MPLASAVVSVNPGGTRDVVSSGMDSLSGREWAASNSVLRVCIASALLATTGWLTLIGTG
jgi:hypothetical protein